MRKLKKLPPVADEIIVDKIYSVRGQKVMIDYDLAELYTVTTGNLNKAVKRNQNRFPPDFMFQLTREEYHNLIFQIGISSAEASGTRSWGGTRKMPYVFTEQGVAMLSSILGSARAIEVNIRIIRVFTRFRSLMLTNSDIMTRLEQLEKKTGQNSRQVRMVFNALRKMIGEPTTRDEIGFKRQGQRKEG